MGLNIRNADVERLASEVATLVIPPGELSRVLNREEKEQIPGLPTGRLLIDGPGQLRLSRFT